jgi:hypothetical protein
VKAVNVGDQVEAAQALAKLNSEDELNALRSAESTFAAAQGQLIYGRGDFERRRQPLANGTHREPGSTSRKTACKAHNPRSMTRSSIADREGSRQLDHSRGGRALSARFGFRRW